MNYDPIFRPHGAAEYLSISRATLYRLVERGQLPAPFKVSRGASGWRKSQLDDFIDRCQNSAEKAYTGTTPALAAHEEIHGLIDPTQHSKLRTLLAVTNFPFMRSDGTMVTTPGYDEATGIYLEPLSVTHADGVTK